MAKSRPQWDDDELELDDRRRPRRRSDDYDDEDEDDDYDDRARRRRAKQLGEDAGMRMLLPVGRSPWAIVAGYAGLLSIIPIFAPLALLTGAVAIFDIKNNPEKHGMGRAIFGLVMGLLFTLFWAFIFITALFIK